MCATVSCTTQHRTVLIGLILPLILQTVIIVQMSDGKEGIRDGTTISRRFGTGQKLRYLHSAKYSDALRGASQTVATFAEHMYLPALTSASDNFYFVLHALLSITRPTTAKCLADSLSRVSGLGKHIPWTGAISNWTHHAAISAYHMNSLCRRCCKPTAHCSKSRDPVNPLEKLRLHRLAL